MEKNNKMAHGFTQINTDNGIKFQCFVNCKINYTFEVKRKRQDFVSESLWQTKDNNEKL